MCTAISMIGKDHYFGRNLDLTYHYSEAVTITPRKYTLRFYDGQATDSHYAIIGIATIANGYPLYYDAVNECGLGACALNFPGNAVYHNPKDDRINIASFEFIPWILSQFSSLGGVKDALRMLNITNCQFSHEYSPTPLHWLIADRENSIVIEPTNSGLRVYDNPIRVLTNSPSFDYHLQNLTNYMNLTAEYPVNRFANTLDLRPYSIGMGGIGLPGDLSSASRFTRAAFQLHNTVLQETETHQVSQFFHILKSVEQTEGCAMIDGKMEKTVYSSCCNTEKGIYYYTTYHNSRITCVDMHKENLNGAALISYPLRLESDIYQEYQSVSPQ